MESTLAVSRRRMRRGGMARLSARNGGGPASCTLEEHAHATVVRAGDREGAEVVQLYLSDTESSVDRPFKELKGFQTF